MAGKLLISRRHLLLEFDEWSQVVVKYVSRAAEKGDVTYEYDHYRHNTIRLGPSLNGAFPTPPHANSTSILT